MDIALRVFKQGVLNGVELRELVYQHLPNFEEVPLMHDERQGRYTQKLLDAGTTQQQSRIEAAFTHAQQ